MITTTMTKGSYKPEMDDWAMAQNPGSHALRGVLLRLAYWADDDGRLCTSLAFMAQRFKSNERCVRRWLRKLKAAGLIEFDCRPDHVLIVLQLDGETEQLPLDGAA